MIHLAALLVLVAPADPKVPPSTAIAEAPPDSEKARTAFRIPDGIDVKLVLDETLSSRSNVKGDLFRLKVAEPVMVDGAEAIAAGTVVIGEVTNAQTKSAFGVSGRSTNAVCANTKWHGAPFRAARAERQRRHDENRTDLCVYRRNILCRNRRECNHSCGYGIARTDRTTVNLTLKGKFGGFIELL